MVLYCQGMSKIDCEKVADDSEQFCPRLRHVLYKYVRDDSGYLVHHLANDFLGENIGLIRHLLLRNTIKAMSGSKCITGYNPVTKRSYLAELPNLKL